MCKFESKERGRRGTMCQFESKEVCESLCFHSKSECTGWRKLIQKKKAKNHLKKGEEKKGVLDDNLPIGRP